MHRYSIIVIAVYIGHPCAAQGWPIYTAITIMSAILTNTATYKTDDMSG